MRISTITGRVLAIDGGTPTRSKPWPTYDKGDGAIGIREEEAAVRAIRSQRLFRYDTRPYAETEVGRFETALRDYFGCGHALAVSSGTAALALSFMAAGIGPGSRVACPVFTFAATPSAILLAGATPVLVPVDEDLHVDLAELERTLPEVDAVVVVHMRGSAEDMDAITALAEQAGVPVFEDAVPAFGVRLRGRLLGTFGRTGSFSTQSDKSINTGEGGFVITEDTELAARATVLSGAYEGRVRRHFGSVALDDLSLPLYSLRMDEVRGAMATVQLETMPARLENLSSNYAYICSMLQGVKGVEPRRAVDSAVLGDALLLRLEGGAVADSTWFAHALRAEGFDARAFADVDDRNVRAFWNWRFLEQTHSGRSERLLAQSARFVSAMVDIPLSASLTPADCEELVEVTARIASHWRTRRGSV